MRKRLAVLSIFLALFLLFPSAASAQSILELDTNATIMENGDLKIDQTWKVDSNKGTELYVPMQYLNHMEIRDFTVSDSTGRTYETLSSWDPSASLEEKAYKCGINHTSDGIELCFGLSGYGERTYYVSYVYENAVQSFPDKDAFNIRFVNDQMNPAPQKAKVTIKLPGTTLTDQNARIWAFGYHGTINFVNGEIVAEADSELHSSNYMTVMVALEKGIIHPTYTGTGTFEDMKKEAFIGSDYTDDNDGAPGEAMKSSSGDDEDLNGLTILGGILLVFLKYVFVAMPIIVILWLVAIANNGRHKIKPLRKVNDVNYFRDVPLAGRIDLIKLFASCKYSIPQAQLLAAYMMSWIQQGALVPMDLDVKKGFIFKRTKRTLALQVVKNPTFYSKPEDRLWHYIQSAAGENGLLEENELQQYAEKYPSSFRSIMSSFTPESCKECEGYGYLTNPGKRLFGPMAVMTETGQKIYENVLGFRKYLKDFTLLDERDIPDVYLWEGYLVAAVLFGVGEKVLERMEKINPQAPIFQASTSTYSTLDIIATTSVLSEATVYASEPKSSSSGSGGSSSSGGGGGSSGGGSGGGIR